MIISGGNPIQKPAGEQLSLLCRVEGAAAYAKPGIHWQKNGGLDKYVYAQVLISRFVAMKLYLTS